MATECYDLQRTHQSNLCNDDVPSLTKAVTAVKALIFCRWIPSLSVTTSSVQQPMYTVQPAHCTAANMAPMFICVIKTAVVVEAKCTGM